MSLTSGMLNQTAVCWDEPQQDGAGGFSFSSASPFEINTRWLTKTELFIDAYGEEQQSTAIVYVDRDISIGAYLFLGELTDLNSNEDPQTQDGAYRIKKFDKSPSMDAGDFVRKVWL